MTSPEESPVFKEGRRREKKESAFIAFFRKRPLESFALAAVLLMIIFKSCANNAARQQMVRWKPGSASRPDAPEKRLEIWKDRLQAPPAPPQDSRQDKPPTRWQERGRPVIAAQTSQAALADPPPSSLHLALAGGPQRLPTAQSLPASGVVFSGGPAPRNTPEGRDPLGLIERGEFPAEEAPVRGEQYPEVPAGLEGPDLIEAMRDDGLMKELKDYAKHETWKSLEKAPEEDRPLPAGFNGFKNSKVVVEILKTRRATDSALYCGGSCKLEKRIRNNRATFYGEKY